MERTPKLSRKALTLSSRLPSSRQVGPAYDSSRQDYEGAGGVIDRRSTSLKTLCSDDIGIECTPPHKRRNLDDSFECSFDASFSPSVLFSQTMALESPEVGWQWGEKLHSRRDSDTSTTTPDSAYAADSSFTSAGSEEGGGDGVPAVGRPTRPRLSHHRRREEQRKAVEMQMRRSEKARAEEELKKRCAKLQEQLNEAASKKSTEEKVPQLSKSIDDLAQSRCTSNTPSVSAPADNVDWSNDTLDNFLNDSDSDCLLLEATQQVESALVRHKPPQSPVAATPPTCTPQTKAKPAESDLNTSTSSTKRSSLYMKFLEDDIADDLFLSLDEVILQATQPKKPRTSLQRYKSMPAETTQAETTLTTTATPKMAGAVNLQCNSPDTASPGGRMKRHASSHSINMANGSYRGRQLRLRK